MEEYLTREGQTVFDVALQLYGGEQYAFEVLKNNPSLNINSEIKNGTVILYEEQNNEFASFVVDKEIDVNTGANSESVGLNKGFDVGFNKGFN